MIKYRHIRAVTQLKSLQRSAQCRHSMVRLVCRNTQTCELGNCTTDKGFLMDVFHHAVEDVGGLFDLVLDNCTTKWLQTRYMQ